MPEQDEQNLLDRLLEAVSTHKDAGNQVKSWWRWPIVIALVLFAVAIFAWFMRRGNRELAKLRHEENKRKIEVEQAIIDAKVDEEKRVIAEYQEKIDEANRRIEEIDRKIAEVEARNAKNKSAIDAIRTWDDVGSSPTGNSG
jgi:septal ring factor EnvC (AmiA/AmiB activator)